MRNLPPSTSQSLLLPLAVGVVFGLGGVRAAGGVEVARTMSAPRLSARMFRLLPLSLLLWAGAGEGRAAVARQTAAAVQPKNQIVALLEPGKPLEGQIAAGETVHYGVSLAAGQFLDVIAAAQGRPVGVSLLRPSGEKVSDASDDIRVPDSEILFLADAPGVYRLELWLEGSGPSASYEVRIETLRPATTADRARARAAAALLEGARRNAEQSEDSLQAALRQYEDSLASWKAAGDGRGEAAALVRIGLVYTDLGQVEKALEYLNRALTMREAQREPAGQAFALNNIGFSYHLLGQMPKALEAHSRALAIAREARDEYDEAKALQNLGSIYGEMGEPIRELEADAQALALFRARGDLAPQAATLNNLAEAYVRFGDWQKALDTEYEVLSLTRAIGERRGEAITLGNLGASYRDLGDLRKALELCEQALESARALGDRRIEAQDLTLIGSIHLLLGDPERALRDLAQALALRREVKDPGGESVTLWDLGRVYEVSGEKRKALETYRESLSLSRAVGDAMWEGRLLAAIGRLTADLGDAATAEQHYTQALSVSRATGDRIGEAQALDGMARLDRDRSHLDAARARLEESLRIFEEVRTQVGSADLRSTFQSLYRGTVDLYVDVLMRLARREPSAGFEALALEASERARARSLLELLKESGAEIRQGVDRALIERETGLRQRIVAKAQLRKGLPRDEPGQAQGTDFDREIDDLTRQHEQVQAQIRATSPRYAALTQPESLKVNAIQGLLDDRTLLLEYWLGEERSFLWIVGPGSMEVAELPARSEIEAAARAAYEELTRPASGARPTRPKAARLSALILGALAGRANGERLLIVADGALQLIPFGALPAPGRRIPLIAEREVVSLPSASLLAVLHGQRNDRAPAPKVLAVLADPVFDRRDGRVLTGRKSGPSGRVTEFGRSGAASERSLTRSMRDLGAEATEPTLPRLPFTRREALGILALAPASGRRAALDFDANRAAATSDDLSQYRYVHFATHGLLNAVHPELSGLVLSLVDTEGRDQDGFLTATEIFNLKLSADLVVLSACRTALGKEIRGEGLVGLTRAFMYAGAPRVVASLWRVDDAATAELMKKFYEGMLGPKKLRPAAALREAQLAIRRQKRWEQPYYWAAFVLQGEWR
jgi:CHAT domain-containing protein/tetratricopeptide (TPR) repeat protein